MSAEPDRKSVYSDDLRWRIVYQRIGMHLSYEEIVNNLNMAVSTAYRTNARFEQTLNVIPAAVQSKRYDLRTPDERSELHVIGLVLANPSMYLSEICQHVCDELVIEVAPPTICRLLRSYGITRKRIKKVALQRRDTVRGAFLAQCLLFPAETFVFMDESGSDARDHIRKYAYALWGLPPISKVLISRGKRVNAVTAISTTRLVGLELTMSTVNADNFFDFARGCLIPNMMPFNGTNPRRIVVMDNLSVHRVPEVLELFRTAGILVLFLPPYSPDLNPIEETFSYVKSTCASMKNFSKSSQIQ
jgi:transposase